ncbi:MAG: ABC transporter substrate-binding protein [Anaerolineaceae bacterium]
MKHVRFQKILFFIVAVVTIVGMVTACAPAAAPAAPAAPADSQAAEPEAPAATEAAPAPAESGEQVVNVLLDAHPWQQVIEKHTEEFTKQTGIKVNLTVLGEDVYWDRVSLGLSSDTPPFDVFMLSPNQTGFTGYQNNWIAPMDDFIADPELTPESYNYKDIYPYIVDGFRFPDSTGKVYGIPLTMETYMLFYRKDLFEEQKIDVASLKTIDDWMAALEKMDAAYKDQGISAAVIRGQDSTMPDELLAAVNNYWGGRPFEAQKMFYFNDEWVPQFTDPAVVEGFKLWAKLVDYGPTGSTAFTWNDCVRQFADGKAATYWFDASVFGSIFEDPAQSSVVGKVGYLPIPASDKGNGTTHWAWGLSIADKSPQKENAWKFIEWATSPEMELVTAPSTFGPVRESTWKAMSDKFGAEFSSAVDASLKMSIPGYMYFPGAREVADRIIDAVIKISQGEDPDKTMEWLNTTSADIVKQQGLVK